MALGCVLASCFLERHFLLLVSISERKNLIGWTHLYVSNHRSNVSGWSQTGQSRDRHLGNLGPEVSCLLGKRPWAAKHKVISLPHKAPFWTFPSRRRKILSSWFFCPLMLDLQCSPQKRRIQRKNQECKDAERSCLFCCLWTFYRNGLTKDLGACVSIWGSPAPAHPLVNGVLFYEGTLSGTYALFPCNVHIQICSVYKSKDVFSSCFQSLKIILASFCFSQLPEQWKMLECEPGWWCWGNVRLGVVLCSVAFSQLSSQLQNPSGALRQVGMTQQRNQNRQTGGIRKTLQLLTESETLFLRTKGTGLKKETLLFRLESRSHPLPLELRCPRELMKMSCVCTVPYSSH